ncbi:MAG: UvrD-helicase domain-containing protein [Flavobacteriia bacterium]|nr:UvrD-helicase domain-containing protein [Flavobacteriia bacterium]
MDYLNGLNEKQKDAVLHYEGPSMVIAGAGSGKTRVLTYRIAHMLHLGIDAFQILALTFTNKAAKEMSERIQHLLQNEEYRNITMGTFHSVFARILRIHAEKLGYPNHFTIYDTEDSKSVLKEIIKEFNLDNTNYKPSAVLSRISAAKNNLISPESYAENREINLEDKMSKRPLIGKIYEYYAGRCKKSGAMDFDDLLYQTNVLFRDYPDVLQYYQHKFRYVLVDEYQDTNYAQYLIVKKLAAVHENICVVGDDAQSIYSFRGANIENILNFRNDYPDYKLFKLEQNYRSTKNIVDAANSIIVKNKNQIKKDIWTENEEGQKIQVNQFQTDTDEGKAIASKIVEYINKNQEEYQDFAILYRTNRQSRSFEEAFLKSSIPYKIYGGISFYQRKEIKDLLAYFRLVINPKDEEALKRIINYPKRGIGKSTLDSLFIKAAETGLSVWDILSDIQNYSIDLNYNTKVKLDEFAKMIWRFHLQVDKLDAYKIAIDIAESSMILNELKVEKTKDSDGLDRYQNVEELMSGIQTFKENENNSLADYLSEISLMTDIDKEKEEDKNKVVLMTIHSSKGLEFKHVFVVGLEENLFPSQMALSDRKDLEEERRLFYVAITRAQKTCSLSHVNMRFVWGNMNRSEPSRFIYEIEDDYVQFNKEIKNNTGKSLNIFSQFENQGGLNKKTVLYSNLKPISQINDNNKVELPKVKVGNNVMHSLFGKGKVTDVIGSGMEKKVVVFFPKSGSKTILLRYSKLEILED